MTYIDILSLVAGIFLIGGYIPYIVEVFQKKTIPNRASWLIWSLSTVTLLFGVHETGTSEAIWVPIADAVGCTGIFILALWKGARGWSMTDKVCLAVSVASLALWYFTGNVAIALVANLLVYVTGYIPTIRKAWINPTTESRTAWSFFFLGVVLNLLVVVFGTDTGWAVWLYPVVLVATVGTLYAILWTRKAPAAIS